MTTVPMSLQCTFCLLLHRTTSNEKNAARKPLQIERAAFENGALIDGLQYSRGWTVPILKSPQILNW